MSQENVEIVRQVYEAVARRDTEAVLAFYDPDVEWDGSRGTLSGDLTGESVARGHEGLRTWFREYYDAWEVVETNPEQLIDAGDEQVISDATLGYDGLWTIRKSKIVRVAWFPSVAEARAAAGLVE